jgi:DNA replication protein DnaC
MAGLDAEPTLAQGLKPDVTEAVARLAPEEQRPSLRDIAHRIEDLKKSIDQAYLQRLRVAKTHAEKDEADYERARLIRTLRDVGTADDAGAEVRAAQLVSALVPVRFRGATFDGYVPKTSSQRLALDTVREFVARTRAGKPTMLALVGPTGTGKSHLIYAALQELAIAAQALGGLYARGWHDLADELRYGGKSAYGGDHRLEPQDVRVQMRGARVVFIDEVRPTANTAFDDTELAKFAVHAYDNALAVFITSNVSPLSDVMGLAAASRFTQFVIDGPDHRQANDLNAVKAPYAAPADDRSRRHPRARWER